MQTPCGNPRPQRTGAGGGGVAVEVGLGTAATSEVIAAMTMRSFMADLWFVV